jgi:GMP synthase (glutamine-hydrolysing)
MILVINCGSDKTPHIHEIVDEFMDVETILFHDLDESKLENYKGIIFSGAPLLVTEIDMTPYLEKVAWLKTTKLPVFGICFGHQLLGITFGAFAARIKDDRDWQTIEAYEESVLFDRLPTEVKMMEDHCETISIPPGFNLIGSSEACVNEVMQHKEKPLFGVQFHPEVSGNHGRVLIENFIRVCQ